MVSCASCKFDKLDNPQYTVNSILPRDSFVKIEVNIKGKSPALNNGEEMDFGSAAASGSIIRKTRDGSYVLTAQHVCEIEMPQLPVPITESKIAFKVLDIDKRSFDAVIFKESNTIDTCVIFVKGLTDRPALKLRGEQPELGDMVYNLAAPSGFFDKGMVPTFQGRYSGVFGDVHAIYTIPAMGGSSGSPIVDRRGNLVGMVFAVHVRFNHISFSPTTKDLYDFIESIKKAPQNPVDC